MAPRVILIGLLAACLHGSLSASSLETDRVRIGIWNIGPSRSGLLAVARNGKPRSLDPEAMTSVIADVIGFDIVILDSSDQHPPEWRELESTLNRRGYRVDRGGMPAFQAKAVVYRASRVRPISGRPLLVYPFGITDAPCRPQDQRPPLYSSFAIDGVELTLAAVRFISDSEEEGCSRQEAHVEVRYDQAEILLDAIKSGQSLRPPLTPVRTELIIVADLNAGWRDPSLSLIQGRGFTLLSEPSRLSRSSRPVADRTPEFAHHLLVTKGLLDHWVSGSTTLLSPDQLPKAYRNKPDFADFGPHLPLWADFDFRERQ